MESLMEAMMGRVMHGVGSFWVFFWFAYTIFRS
jgi:hypothetical protein